MRRLRGCRRRRGLPQRSARVGPRPRPQPTPSQPSCLARRRALAAPSSPEARRRNRKAPALEFCLVKGGLHLCAPALAQNGGGPRPPEAACALLAGPRTAPQSRRSCGLHRRLLLLHPTRNCAGNEYFATTARETGFSKHSLRVFPAAMRCWSSTLTSTCRQSRSGSPILGNNAAWFSSRISYRNGVRPTKRAGNSATPAFSAAQRRGRRHSDEH